MTGSTLLLAVLFVGEIALILSILDLQEFLRKVTVLEDMKQLVEFKRLVRRQMYASLALTVWFWIAALVAIYAAALSSWSLGKGVILALLVGSLQLTGRFKKKLRDEIRTLPAQDKGVESLHQAVCVQWASRSLPEF